MGNSAILEGLNDDQKQAVLTLEGPLLVVAGPGTGKTMTLVRRIAHLIESGVKPEAILALTFTNRAAREMRERLNGFLGGAGSGIFAGTFHLLGLRILRDMNEQEFVLFNRKKQIDLLRRMTGSLKKAEEALEKISMAKNMGVECPPSVLPGDCYAAYEEALRSEGAFDFDDLIRIPAETLKEDDGWKKYGAPYRYIMVDEYQDTNPSQYRFLKGLVGAGRNICAVGDSDQAIYAFRGADVENFLRFKEDFPGASVVNLRRNYRSTETIVRASGALIARNGRRIEKPLEAVKERGPSVAVVSTPDERGEGKVIADEIEGRIGATSHYRLLNRSAEFDFGAASHSPADFAVLFRTNAQASVLAESFADAGIPYRIIGGRKPTKGEDIATMLRSMIDDLPLGESLDKLLKKATSQLPVSDDDGLFLDQLKTAYGELPLEEAVIRVADELDLTTPMDRYDRNVEAVTLTTLHGAKGLEFRVVFIAGVEEGMIPFGRKDNGTDMEEERRLFYVGMTRAIDELWLTHRRNRTIHGQRAAQQPSSFIGEITPEFLKKKNIPDMPKKPAQRQMKLF